MSDPAPKRRWFRWSLRSMFVVVTMAAMLLGWIVYSLNWIHERRHVAILRASPPWDVRRIVVASYDGTPPAFLWLFGEPGYQRLRVVFPDDVDENHLSGEQRKLVERIRLIFPEATVQVMPPYTGKSIDDPDQ